MRSQYCDLAATTGSESLRDHNLRVSHRHANCDLAATTKVRGPMCPFVGPMQLLQFRVLCRGSAGAGSSLPRNERNNKKQNPWNQMKCRKFGKSKRGQRDVQNKIDLFVWNSLLTGLEWKWAQRWPKNQSEPARVKRNFQAKGCSECETVRELSREACLGFWYSSSKRIEECRVVKEKRKSCQWCTQARVCQWKKLEKKTHAVTGVLLRRGDRQIVKNNPASLSLARPLDLWWLGWDSRLL